MPSIDKRLQQRLIAKFGPTINLESDFNLISDILKEVVDHQINPHGIGGSVNDPAYDKTYTEGYNKDDYSKADYHRYDRSADLGDEIEKVVLPALRPELEKLILEKLRSRQT